MNVIDKIYLPATGGEIGFYVDSEKPKYVYYDLIADDSQHKVLSRLSASDVKSLISSLQKAKNKYEEWSKVAIDEDCRLLSKKIPQIFKDQTIYFTDDNKWFRETGVDIKAMFSVDANGRCYLILQSDRMESEEVVGESSSIGGSSIIGTAISGIFGSQSKVSVDHRCSGASLTFSSIIEIDNFITKLQNALNWGKQQKSKSSIFK